MGQSRSLHWAVPGSGGCWEAKLGEAPPAHTSAHSQGRTGSQPGGAVPHLSRQTNQPQEEGRLMTAAWGVWEEGSAASPHDGHSRRVQVHRGVWKAPHTAGLITRQWLNSNGRPSPPEPLEGTTASPRPEEGSSAECSDLPPLPGCRSLGFQSVLSPNKRKCHPFSVAHSPSPPTGGSGECSR